MKLVFADTGYWIALLDRKDSYHQKALELKEYLKRAHIVTSQMVITELLADASSAGAYMRQLTVQAVRRFSNSPGITIIPQTNKLFTQAFNLYATVPDKQWSLTDCASFEIMRSKGIIQALAHDKHFKQAGFVPLLR